VSMRHVVEEVTLEDLVRGPLPTHIVQMVDNPDAWVSG
jgi:hypothetical protein